MEFVEGDDERSFRRPPDPDDRVWRHPSELRPPSANPRPDRRQPAPRSLWLVAVTSAFGASLLTMTAVISLGALDDGEPAAGPTTTSTASPIATLVPLPDEEPVALVADRLAPSVVQLQVARDIDGTMGSGVIFRADGHVITNAHVVTGAVSIKARLSDGRIVGAEVVGADGESDIAVVKLEGGPYEPAEMADPDTLRVGQQAVAIGSPLALAGGPSVTAGVISALHRTVRTQGGQALYDMIQTDAPISPGSSGGALVSIAGEVIGITTAVSLANIAPEALGFATPSDVAASIAGQIVASGHAVPVWLGIEGNDLEGSEAHELGVQGGAVVNVVRTGSPADRAGIVARDVIVSIDGNDVTSMGKLVVTLRKMTPGEDAAVGIIRDGESRTMQVVLTERPPDA